MKTFEWVGQKGFCSMLLRLVEEVQCNGPDVLVYIDVCGPGPGTNFWFHDDMALRFLEAWRQWSEKGDVDPETARCPEEAPVVAVCQALRDVGIMMAKKCETCGWYNRPNTPTQGCALKNEFEEGCENYAKWMQDRRL